MFGVVIFGYTSHIFLPSLEASMKVSVFVDLVVLFSVILLDHQIKKSLKIFKVLVTDFLQQ